MNSEPTTYPSQAVSDLVRHGQFGHVIDGKKECDALIQPYDVLNPASGKPLVTINLGTAADVDRAVDAARRALPEWSGRTPADRAAVLLAMADLIDANAELLSQLESLNVGKPLAMSREEIPASGDVLRFMAGAIRTVQTPASGEYVKGYVSMIRREALGVVGAITPWNYPLTTAVWKIAPALAAGNTMVLKPSELTPLTTALFAELASELLPPGVLNVVLGDGPEVGRAISEHPGVDMVSLTGSVASGIQVATSAAATLKRVHLELGGKAPVLVFDDADLDSLVASLRFAAFWNTGQECGAATRVVCAAPVRDALLDKLSAAAGSLQIGAPEDGEHIELGPLVSERHLNMVEGLVQAAVTAGATLVLGGSRVADRPGFFYEPTIITDIPAGAEIVTKEIFGPVVTVQTFESEAEAIEMANGVNYGLGASVWTENTRRALRLVDALDCGTVWVNAHLVTASEMPWVGFGYSGDGRELSVYAIDDFSRTKHVMMAK